MQTARPVFLDLWRIKLPLSGLVSILHRVSGVLMVLSIPLAAALFHHALASPQGFEQVVVLLDTWIARLLLFLLAWSLLHHLFAGIRHWLLDLGFGLDRPQARVTARVVLILTPLVLVLGWLLGLLLGGGH